MPPDTKPREQMTEENIKKFKYRDTNMRVYIQNTDELQILSKYLEINLLSYFVSYFGGNLIVVPIIIEAKSNGKEFQGTMKDDLAKAFNLDTFNKQKSVPLEVFLNPQNYPYRFI